MSTSPLKRISGTVGAASGLVGSLGKALGAHLLHSPKRAAEDAPAPGSSPGIESMPEVATPPVEGAVRVRCLDYGPELCTWNEVGDLEAFVGAPRPEGGAVRWINVDGLHPYTVDRLRADHGFHTLAAEDVLRTPQRPKVEEYEDHLFVVMRMLMVEGGEVRQEQVSFFLFSDTVITFQERAGDVWDPVRDRLSNAQSRLRRGDPSFLLYALVDAIVDHCFPLLERYGEHLETLEDEVVENATPSVQRRIHQTKRELATLRRVVWPTREVLSTLMREERSEISEFTRTYLRDVYDHTIQVMDIVESHRETAASLNDLYMSVVSNRMNEIMKVLTLMASFFIPITFIAGVYGMNFEHIPELSWRFGYAGFWAACGLASAGLAFFFWRKGWIGGGGR